MWKQFKGRQDLGRGVHIVCEKQQGGHCGLHSSGPTEIREGEPSPVTDSPGRFSDPSEGPNARRWASGCAPSGRCMPETTAMVNVSLHYWAGAKAAAGVERETVEAATVADAVAIAAQRHGDPRFARILNVSSVLMEDRVLRGNDLEKELTESVEVEVLPPFAGG